MDIRMPEMSGLEATRLIRKYRKDLPIVVYSALNQPEYKHLMKKLNCEDFLLKPVHPNIILDTLSKYLDPYIRVSSSPDIF
jgi:CheY-like chemotaxis protein